MGRGLYHHLSESLQLTCDRKNYSLVHFVSREAGAQESQGSRSTGSKPAFVTLKPVTGSRSLPDEMLPPVSGASREQKQY